MNDFIKIFKYSCEIPRLYGSFHLLFILLTVICAVIVALCLKNADDKGLNIFLWVVWGLLLLLEIYKAIAVNISYVDGVVHFEYDLTSIPLQLCSTPLYIIPIAVLLPQDNRFKEGLLTYLSTFTFLGGISVLIYPKIVFTDNLGLNIMTMIWHLLLVTLAVGIIAQIDFEHAISSIHIAIGVFVFVVLIDTGLNYLLPVNLLYISPNNICNIPVLSLIQPHVHPINFTIIYTWIVLILCLLMYFVIMKIKRKM